MIVSAKYIGPFPEVNFNGVTAKPGEVVRLRVPEGQTLAGCWEVVEEGQSKAQALIDEVNAFKMPDTQTPADRTAEGAPGASAGSQKKKGD